MANRSQLYDYKGNCCAHCGRSVKEMIERYGTIDRMFEFNHVDPAQKDADYDNLIRRVISTEQLDEVDKCILLCRQCHGVLHAQGINGHVEYTFAIGERSATQSLSGQIIADRLDRSVSFLTNERILVVPYFLQIGDRQPQLTFGTELEKDNALLASLHGLATGESMDILSYREGRVLLRAINTGEVIEMAVDISFPVLTFDLCETGPHDQILWIRHGVALHKNGEIMRRGTVTVAMDLARNGA